MKKLLILLMVVVLVACNTSPTMVTWIADIPEPVMRGAEIFPSVPDSLWSELGIPNGAPSSVSCFVLQMDGKICLVDAGVGGPSSLLFTRLDSMGIDPKEVRDIYLTHLHGDHIGGLIRNGVAAFPNATLNICEDEFYYWMQLPEEQRAKVELMAIAYNGSIYLFKPGEKINNSIRAIHAPGHTPGHTCYLVQDSILFMGDIMHGAALQIPHPEYCACYDMDSAAAVSARLWLEEYIRDNHVVAYGAHLPAPGYITGDVY